MRIAVVDYGAGNIGSICNIIHKTGADVDVLSSPEGIANADSIILPGVGAFDNAINKLEEGGWVEPLSKYAMVDRKPLLGICLGMQLFTRSSQEGVKKGLGFIDADTIRFSEGRMAENQRVPHMGWNVADVQKENVLFDPNEPEERFYFVHSYHVVCDSQEDVLTTTNYGYDFVSSFQKDNIVGVQFHPEKSHRFGYEFFKRLVRDFSA